MSVLAERGGGIRLVDDGDGMGHVESGRGVGPSLPVETILKWGYWRPVAQVAASWAADEPTADEAPLARKYEQVLERNAVRCRARFRRASKAVTAAGEEQNRNPQLDEILNDKQLAESATKATQAKRKQIAEEAARALALEMGISFALTNPYIKRLVQAQAGKQAERIVAGVREIVARVIEQSLDEGWSVPQTADVIYEHLHDAKKWQATMLARTDLIAMGNGGSFAAASALAESQPVFKRWITAEDDKVRPTHVEADRQLQTLQSPFQVGGAQLLFPGDPDGPDGEVINCRCVIVYTDDPDKLVSSAWGQTSAAWNEADHPRDPGGEGGGEFVEKGTAGGDDDGPTEVQGGSIDEILEKMGAFEYENNPERNPGRFMKHPKSGFNVEVPGLVYPETVMHDPSGQKPPRVRDVTNGAGFAPPPGHEDAKSLGYGKYQVGEERPPDYLFRAVSEAEYQGILKNGYMQSDQRMNLSNDEGTVVAFSDPRYYLPGALASDKPGTYEGRVIRIKYRDEDGWRHDTDDYVKTSQRVPLSQIDMVTPKLTRKVTRNEGKDWNDIGDYSLSAAIWAEVAAAWDESKHPRDPGGEDGGQFITNGDDDVQAAMEKYLPTIGVPVNDDGTVTLYHAGNVDEIEREGFVKGTTGKSTGPVAVSDAAWFTPQKDKTERWSGGGTRKVLEVHVPARYVSHMPALDDSGDVEVFFEGGLRRQPDGTWAPDEQPDTFAQRLAKRRHLTSSAWAEVAAGWDESEHPREPAGSREGGRFASLAAVQAANPDAGLWAHESSGGVKLDQIKVPPELRGRGLASKALDDVLAYADQRGMPVALTIGHDPEDHGLTKGQKEQWYRGRGFVPNKGRNKDFAFTEAWIRPARGATAAAWDEGLHPRDEIGRWRDKGGGALARTPGQMVAEDVVRSSAWDESEHPRVPSGGTTSGQTAAGFDESQHPRHPKGDSKGGKFAPKGDDLFQPTVGAWDEYLDATARQDAAWDAWLVSNQERYGHLAVGMFPSNADLEAVAAKTQVQDSIAAQLEGDEDFKSLVAALDPYGDWAAEFEPGGSMPTAGTVEKQVAALATATWARTSGDTDPIALQFQIAAEREFGLDANPFVHEAFDSILRDEQDRGLAEGDAYRNREIFTDQQMSGARKFLRAQYDLTQAMFADAGITHVYGYRGMAWQPGTEPADVRGLMDARYERGHGLAAGVVAVQGNPLSSWSTSFGTSTMFASKYDIHAIVGTKIDVRRVLSTPLTGLGCLNEREMVVLGGDDMDGFTWVWNNRYLRSSADPSVQTDDVVQATPGPGWATGDRANEEEEFVTEWGDWMRRVHG